ESMKAYKEVCTIDENSVEINIDKFLELHEAIKNRVIRFSIRDVLGDTNFVDQKHIEEVIQFIRTSKNGKVINLPRGVFVYRKLDTILFTMEEIKEENLEFNYNIPKDGFIKIKELGLLIDSSKISIEKYRSLKKDEMVKAIDFDKIKGGITVRNRKPGDKIKLKGGTKKIKDLFIDLKIPREDRNRVPILVDEDGVILAGEYRVSENYKIDETTKNVLKLSIKKL
ncbi:tRNA lysidine(34) synthetase TilS, partial [Peptacetobacter sp.]